MQRRVFLETAGVLAAASQAHGDTQGAGVAGMSSSVVLDILGGTIDSQIETAARSGCGSAMLLNQYAAWSDADFARATTLCQSSRLSLHGLLGQVDWKKRPVSIVDPAHREGFLGDVRNAIVVARRLGVTQIVVTSGLAAAGQSSEQQYASLSEGVKRAADLVGQAGLTLLVEPLNSLVDHPGCFLSSCVEGLKLVREVNHPHARLLFDIYHEQVMRGNLIRTLTEAAPLVGLIHVADNPGRNDPGSGEINFPNVYRAIRKSGYTGRIAMEYRPLGEPVASLSKAVKGIEAALAG